MVRSAKTSATKTVATAATLAKQVQSAKVNTYTISKHSWSVGAAKVVYFYVNSVKVGKLSKISEKFFFKGTIAMPTFTKVQMNELLINRMLTA